MRLKFETDGIVYNLGVIDNKQTGGREPINETKTWIEVGDDGCESVGLYICIIVFLIIGAMLIIKFLPDILTAVFYLIKYILIGVYYILASPFYFIRWIVRKKQ